MRLVGVSGSQRRVTGKKMKFLFFASLLLAIVYITVASILPALDGGKPPLVQVASNFVNLHEAPLTEATLNNNNASKASGDFFEVSENDVANLKSLQLVQVIFRHGDRTPLDRYPKDPYDSLENWPEGRGHLTNRGKRMQYHLGQSIRKRYDGFLPKVYRRPEEIYVRSSDKDRAILSAMANLKGMFEGQQFVPVHTISASVDNKIAFSKPCPKYAHEYSQVNRQPSEEAFNKGQKEFYAFLSENTGLNITSYFNVSDIYDTLFVQTAHNLPLPPWTKSVFPDKLRPMAERWLKAQTFTENMRRLRAGPILTEIIQNMKRVTMAESNENTVKLLEQLFGTPEAKFHVFSGHDTTISAVLDALGLLEGTIPPYASSLYFEVHQNQTSTDNNNLAQAHEYYVQIFYKPDYTKPAKELELKQCPSKPCRVQDFIKSLENYIFDDAVWEAECMMM